MRPVHRCFRSVATRTMLHSMELLWKLQPRLLLQTLILLLQRHSLTICHKLGRTLMHQRSHQQAALNQSPTTALVFERPPMSDRHLQCRLQMSPMSRRRHATDLVPERLKMRPTERLLLPVPPPPPLPHSTSCPRPAASPPRLLDPTSEWTPPSCLARRTSLRNPLMTSDQVLALKHQNQSPDPHPLQCSPPNIQLRNPLICL